MNRSLRASTTFIGLLLLSQGLLLVTPIQSSAASQNTINWYVTDWEPFNITRGKLKHKGINDKLIQYIHRYLPNYAADWQVSNPSLLEKAFSSGQNACQLDLFKTPEREKIAYFSKFPTIIDAPLRLFIKADDEDKMGLKNPVDIVELLNNQNYSGSFVDRRSYSATIDHAINNTTNPRIERNESTKRIIKEFFKDKNHYVVEYSAVISFFKTTLKYQKGISSLAIKDTEPYVLGYAACSKSLWGKTAIDAIDNVLKAHRHDREYLDILEEWHDERTKKVMSDNYVNF